MYAREGGGGGGSARSGVGGGGVPRGAASFVYFTRGPALALLVAGLLALLDVVIFYFG